TSNFHKCALRVGMGYLRPFSVIKSYANKTALTPINANEIKGCDYEILKILAAKVNATLNLYKIKTLPINSLAEVTFVKYLENNTLDVCGGGLYNVYGTTIKYSGIYARQVIIWTYAVEREPRSFKNVISIVDKLYMSFVIYIIYSLLWYLVSWFDGKRVSLSNTLLYNFGSAVGAAKLQIARTTKQKILQIIYILLCFFTVAYFNIEIYSCLTISNPPTLYKTSYDIMNSGKKVYLYPDGRNFIKDVNYLNFFKHAEDCDSFRDCVWKVCRNKGITVLLDGQFIEYQVITANNDEARLMRSADNIITVFHEMPISKDSLVLETFQNLMVKLAESGILNRLYDEAVGILDISKSEVFTKSALTKGYYCMNGCSITLKGVAAVFCLWFLGVAVSCFVLFLEITIAIYQKH
ncbi:uncharacterized protein LOC132902741, partial [Amyelois transitella]|uniref:uncharacterized protein LOC132902741 n=1 Tax=Amyelois transitella TaxID=680683 RepID=UPI0029904A9D